MSNETVVATTTSEVVPQMEVVLVTDTGKKTLKVPSMDYTWSGLQKELEKQGTSFKNIKVIEGTTKATFEHPDIVIPQRPKMFLFLMLVQSKSGGEVRDKVKALFAKNKEAAKQHFGNYTQVKEPVLAELMKTYKESNYKVATKEAKPKAAKKAKETKPTKEAKEKAPVVKKAKSLKEKETVLEGTLTEEVKTQQASMNIADVVDSVQAAKEPEIDPDAMYRDIVTKVPGVKKPYGY